MSNITLKVDKLYLVSSSASVPFELGENTVYVALSRYENVKGRLYIVFDLTILGRSGLHIMKDEIKIDITPHIKESIMKLRLNNKR